MSAKQLELFRGTSLRDAPSFRDDIDLMSLPCFPLSRIPQHEAFEYTYEVKGRQLYIRVSPGEEGIATIYDNDILIYLRTLLTNAINEGRPVSNRIQFVVGDCLSSIRRQRGKSEYDGFLASLKRLKTTTIYTNITVGDIIEDQGFGWIQQFKVVRKRNAAGSENMIACEVVLSDWFFAALMAGNRSLAIDPAYFDLSGGLERKLYMIARRHIGNQRIPWTCGLENLHEKLGTKMPLRRFKFELNKLAEQGLLNYTVELVQELAVVRGKSRKRGGLKVVFRDRT